MKKVIIIIYIALIGILCGKAQYIPDLLIDDIIPSTEEEVPPLLTRGSSYNLYNNLRTWIPYLTEPLKSPPITTIEITFHVFLDNNGQNNQYTNTVEGRNRLIEILNLVNDIYSGTWFPSDPVVGVIPLPSRDTRIRFSLGNNNERIYFYNNTTNNHLGSPVSSFENYISGIYPSRLEKLNIYFTAGYYGAQVIQENISITNGGSGYTSPPTISFNPSGATATAEIEGGRLKKINIVNSGFYTIFNPPQIIISGGGGSGASAIVTKFSGGATGYANMPQTNLSSNSRVVMCNCYQANDWVYGMTLAHELGHTLDLRHTYCGGGAPAVICSDYCSIKCSDLSSSYCNDDEYLSDIFGPCPGTYPHNTGWYDPTSNDPKHTNNMMGGSNSFLYISPMQAGQMHRALALKSVRKYVKKETYSNIPFTITSNETWDFNLKLYRDITIVSGAILTMDNTFEFPYNGTITVNNGAALVIAGNVILNENNKIVVKSGGTLKISSSSNLQINSSGKIEVQSGGYFCLEQGADIVLTDYNSVINLRYGYIKGVNTVVVPSSNCSVSPTLYTTIGNGKINEFSNIIYIQNETISTNRYYAGRYIYVGNSVTPFRPNGDVLINNSSNVIFDAEYDVLFDRGFEVSPNSSFEIPKKE
jgi:hypothetical protein